MINPNFYTQKIDESNVYSKFIIEPLSPSLGQSIGHALRRTLLSSLKGAAITNIKISGVSHPFSTIKGVKESVLDIILNMKQLRFKFSGDGPFKITLNARKKGKLLGKDVEGEVEVVNKDLYIAEITDDKGRIEIEAKVETGIGFSLTEEREKNETGYIPVDAFFSPVKKVNFKVEEVRVGKKTNLDRLILEIWTDGSIKPSAALREATVFLAEHFNHILSGKDTFKPKEELSQAEVEKEAIEQKLYEIIIDELNLPSRVINALLRENIETVADLVKAGKEKLTGMKGVGKKSIDLIEEELKKMGIELK